MITANDVCAIKRYVDDVMSRMGRKFDAAHDDCSVEIDGESMGAKVKVPHDMDAGKFCDMLAQLLGKAGYSMFDVWIDQWNPTTVNIDDKEEEVP